MNDRRARLLDRIGAQREALASQALPMQDAARRLDRGLRALQYLQRNPLLAVGGSAVLLLLVRTYARGSWMHYGWRAWRLLRHLRR